MEVAKTIFKILFWVVVLALFIILVACGFDVKKMKGMFSDKWKDGSRPSTGQIVDQAAEQAEGMGKTKQTADA